MTDHPGYTTDVNGNKTSNRWVYETIDLYDNDNLDLIPQTNTNIFRKLIKPTDFLSGGKITNSNSDAITQGYQRLKTFDYADMQYPSSTNIPTSDYPAGSTYMRWDEGNTAIARGWPSAYLPGVSYVLYSGISLFNNNTNELLSTYNIPEIYCFIDIPFGYKVKKSYIYVADMRKPPYTSEDNKNNNNIEDIKFEGITIQTQVITYDSINDNFDNRYISLKTDTDDTIRDKAFVHNCNEIIYEEDDRLKNNNPQHLNKILLISLKYIGYNIDNPISDNNYKDAIYQSNFAVIKGGWIEFEKIL